MASALNKFQNLILTLVISTRYIYFYFYFYFHFSWWYFNSGKSKYAVMSQKSHCTQPNMYKYFYYKTEIKTKVDSYMPCEAMAHSPKYSYALACMCPYNIGPYNSIRRNR